VWPDGWHYLQTSRYIQHNIHLLVWYSRTVETWREAIVRRRKTSNVWTGGSRYDTIRHKSLMWTKKCGQLNRDRGSEKVRTGECWVEWYTCLKVEDREYSLEEHRKKYTRNRSLYLARKEMARRVLHNMEWTDGHVDIWETTFTLMNDHRKIIHASENSLVNLSASYKITSTTKWTTCRSSVM